MQNINTENSKRFGNGLVSSTTCAKCMFYDGTQFPFQRGQLPCCYGTPGTVMPGINTGQSAHGKITLSSWGRNLAVKAIQHLVCTRTKCLEAAIRMTCVCTYLHVRSSNNWHLRSKYSVHWDKSLKQVQIKEKFNLNTRNAFLRSCL